MYEREGKDGERRMKGKGEQSQQQILANTQLTHTKEARRTEKKEKKERKPLVNNKNISLYLLVSSLSLYLKDKRH